MDTVKSKLDQPLALGYCNVGEIIEANETGFARGDRVVSNGNHAEIVAVPKNLCAKIPENVSNEAASFTVLASIGLQGIRLAKLTLGETVVVTGLGLIGLLTVQMLRAQGCRVLGIDFDPIRLGLARSFGAETVDLASGEDVLDKAYSFSDGMGVDAVIITAATRSSEPMSQAANMCRKRGRIVLVGVVGLEINREDFYEKELTFQVSCSYGPGRYDSSYEEKGNDYPVGYVRWTEQRNFEAVLQMISSGLLDLTPLITHRFHVQDGNKAMDLLTSKENALGILMNFWSDHHDIGQNRRVKLYSGQQTNFEPAIANVAFFGAGNYASRVLIPAFKEAGALLNTLVSNGGVSAVHFGKKFGFSNAASDLKLALADKEIDTVVVATRHDIHAQQVLAALRACKHVYCEKPLCLNLNDLDEIQNEVKQRPKQRLFVGFNRRFAPHTKTILSLISSIDAPKSFILTINAGDVPKDHWVQSIEVGGGRIIGEACHFIDLLRHLAGSCITDWNAVSIGCSKALDVSSDKTIISLRFEDGSIGVINYLANGHKKVPKERLEIFTAGRVIQLDNFIKLKAFGWKNFKGKRLWKQDKGQRACPREFINSIRSGAPSPIPIDEIIESSRISIEISESLNL